MHRSSCAEEMGNIAPEELLLQGKAPDAINTGTQDRHTLSERAGKDSGLSDARNGQVPVGPLPLAFTRL